MASKYKVFAYGSRKAFPAQGLAVGTRLPFDVFVKEGNVFTRVHGAGALFGPEEREALRRRGATEAYVDAKDARELDLYLLRTSEEKPPDLSDPAVIGEYLGHRERYHQVDRSFLVPGTRVGFGIYRLCDLRLIPVVEATEDAPCAIHDGIAGARGDIVIRNEDIPLYQGYLDGLLDGGAEIAASPERKEKIRAVVIKEKSKAIIKELLDDPRSGENIGEAVGLVSKIADCILSNRDILYDLLSLSSYDLYTYTHSVNVSVLSAGIGIAHGLGRADVEILGVGAILHDLGKSCVPPAILNKPGKLTSPEFEVVKSHVVEGDRILRMHEAIRQGSRDVVLQHHERLSGGGYPFGLSGHAIRLFGRICAIADCYDAMTTHRPYQAACTPYEALLRITKQAPEYDGDLLATFIRMLGRIKAPEKPVPGTVCLPAGISPPA